MLDDLTGPGDEVLNTSFTLVQAPTRGFVTLKKLFRSDYYNFKLMPTVIK